MTPDQRASREHDSFASILIALLAIVMLLAAVIAFLTGSSLLYPSVRWHALWNLNPSAHVAFQTLGTGAAYLLLGLAAVCVCSGLGLYWRRIWAWWAALLLFSLNGVGDLIQILASHQYARYGAGVVIALCFVLLLTMPGVRRQMR